LWPKFDFKNKHDEPLQIVPETRSQLKAHHFSIARHVEMFCVRGEVSVKIGVMEFGLKWLWRWW